MGYARGSEVLAYFIVEVIAIACDQSGKQSVCGIIKPGVSQQVYYRHSTVGHLSLESGMTAHYCKRIIFYKGLGGYGIAQIV